MTNQVTAYAICKAFRDTKANAMTAKAIAQAEGIETTSENLQEIKTQIYDMIEIGRAESFLLNGERFYKLA